MVSSFMILLPYSENWLQFSFQISIFKVKLILQRTRMIYRAALLLWLLFSVSVVSAKCSQETIESHEDCEVGVAGLEMLQANYVPRTRLMPKISRHKIELEFNEHGNIEPVQQATYWHAVAFGLMPKITRNTTETELIEHANIDAAPQATDWHAVAFVMILVIGTLLNNGALTSLHDLLGMSWNLENSNKENSNKDQIAADVGVTAVSSHVMSNAGLMKYEPPPTSSSVLALLADTPTTALCKDGCDPEALSYSQLRHQIAHAELSFYFRDGERVALVLDNGKDMAVCMLAVMQRACAVPLNPTFTDVELKASMEQFGCSVAVVRPGSAGEAARNVASSLGLRALTLGKGRAGKVINLEGTRLQGAPITATHPAPDGNSDVLLLKTSGTTSKGKIVTFSVERLSMAARINARCMELGPESICLSMMPLNHIAGISVNFLASMSAGATVLFYSGLFDVTRFVAELERSDEFKPTWYFAVPAVHDAVLSHVKGLGRPVEHRLSLIRSAGSALMQQTGLQLIETFNCGVVPAYGMTEALEITCPPRNYQLERPGSVGPSISSEIKLIHGEICIRGDLVMSGYEFHGPAEEDPNAEVWTEGARGQGFLRTGDLGHMDMDGWVFLTGRCKEMINRGGETINPHEVELAMVGMPGLDVAICLAAPHKALGECVAAAIVLKEGLSPHELPPKDILDHCSTQSSDIMRPEVFMYLPREALPTTATKKFIRAGLAQRLGLTSELLLSHSVFIYDEAGKSLKPSNLPSPTERIKDSLGELREASIRQAVEQRLIDSLYCIGELQVMNAHWARVYGNWRKNEHPGGADQLIPSVTFPHTSFLSHEVFDAVLRDKSTFMFLFFILSGYGASQVTSRNGILLRWAKYCVLKTVACMIAVGTSSLLVDWFFVLLLAVEIITIGISSLFSLILPKSRSGYASSLAAGASIALFIIMAAFTNTARPANSDLYQALLARFGYGVSFPLTNWSNLLAGNLYVGRNNGHWICGGQLFLFAAAFAIGFHSGPKLSNFLWSRPDLLRIASCTRVRLCSVVAVVLLLSCSPQWPTETDGWWWLGKPRETIEGSLFLELFSCVACLTLKLLFITLMAIAVGAYTWPLHKLGQNTIGALVSHAAFATYRECHFHVQSPWPFHDVLQPSLDYVSMELNGFENYSYMLMMIVMSVLYMSSIGEWVQIATEALLRRPWAIVPVWAIFLVFMQLLCIVRN